MSIKALSDDDGAMKGPHCAELSSHLFSRADIDFMILNKSILPLGLISSSRHHCRKDERRIESHQV